MTNHEETLPVLVVGAGIGGLVAALALHHVGLPVAVFEQVSELSEVGAGLTMYPNATRALEYLGLGDALAAVAVIPEDGGVRHWQTGELLRHFPVGSQARTRYGAPQYFVHRADLQELLVGTLRARVPGALHLDHAFLSYEEQGNQVVAHFANGATVAGRALIGCDGIHSRVRECLFGPDAPRFTGKVAWRGLVPMERLSEQQRTPTSCLWTGPDHAFLRYPVRGGRLMNYVAHAAQGAWAEESWKLPSEVSEVLAEFAGWDPAVLAVIAATPPELCFKWALFDRDPLPRWSVGRVTLLGDAAHPALPYLGQGAGMAIEDGMVLARCLALEPAVPAALQRYEAARQPRCQWVQRESRANGDRFFEADPTARYQDGRAQSSADLEQALRYYDATSVPV
ncbi:MAG: FAD-dependent monooxygenase [Chloroflexi bacterium]|nr:FAD-dependent monooxygenase [Chloroflexota bacterium]